MIYYKDLIQIRELNKISLKTINNIKDGLPPQDEIENHQKEIKYWTEIYPLDLQVWEDDGGCINEDLLNRMYENYFG